MSQEKLANLMNDVRSFIDPDNWAPVHDEILIVKVIGMLKRFRDAMIINQELVMVNGRYILSEDGEAALPSGLGESLQTIMAIDRDYYS